LLEIKLAIKKRSTLLLNKFETEPARDYDRGQIFGLECFQQQKQSSAYIQTAIAKSETILIKINSEAHDSLFIEQQKRAKDELF